MIVDDVLVIETREDARLAQHLLAELGRRVLEVDLLDGVLDLVDDVARFVHRAETSRCQLLDLLKIAVIAREEHALVDDFSVQIQI